MNIAVLYQDLFRMEKAVPAESRAVIAALADYCEVEVMGRDGAFPVSGVKNSSYSKLGGMWRHLKRLSHNNMDCIIIQAPFTKDAVVACLFSWVLGLKVVVQNFGQISGYAMGRQLFGKNPDVRSLEAETPSTQKGSLAMRVRTSKSKVGKYGLIRIYRLLDSYWISGWLVFSHYSRAQLCQLVGVDPERCLSVPWPANPVSKTITGNWYEAKGLSIGKLRFVYWGRVDYEMKGLDRLVKGVSFLLKHNPELRQQLVIYIIGPDYNGGEELFDSINNSDLSDIVVWLKPDQYEPGCLDPLRDADASILLSRWDGFPRSLRESLGLGVPIFVSKETHFGDIVKDYDCGIVIENSDSADDVSEGLRTLFNECRRMRGERNPQTAFSELSPSQVGKNAIVGIEQLIRTK